VANSDGGEIQIFGGTGVAPNLPTDLQDISEADALKVAKSYAPTIARMLENPANRIGLGRGDFVTAHEVLRELAIMLSALNLSSKSTREELDDVKNRALLLETILRGWEHIICSIGEQLPEAQLDTSDEDLKLTVTIPVDQAARIHKDYKNIVMDNMEALLSGVKEPGAVPLPYRVAKAGSELDMVGMNRETGELEVTNALQIKTPPKP